MIDVKLLHPKKVYPPILVTELGIVIDVKLLQPSKARLPILVIEFGIVIDVKLLLDLYLQLVVYQFVLIKTIEK